MSAKYYVVTAIIFGLLAVALFILPTRNTAIVKAESFDSSSNALIVTNAGTAALTAADVYVDDVKVAAKLDPIPPGQKGTIYLDKTPQAGDHSIKVVADGSISIIDVNVPETWIASFQITGQ